MAEKKKRLCHINGGNILNYVYHDKAVYVFYFGCHISHYFCKVSVTKDCLMYCKFTSTNGSMSRSLWVWG